MCVVVVFIDLYNGVVCVYYGGDNVNGFDFV